MKGAFGDVWKDIGGGMWAGSFAILALIVAVGISYNLAKSYGVDALSALLHSVP